MNQSPPVLERMTEKVGQAAEILSAGGLVAFPTETVYGLGADATNPDALAKLYALKGRPGNHPVIVHCADAESAFAWVAHLPEDAILLAEQFWPGPLTLILPKAVHVLDQITGGQSTVGIRVPNQPLALALLNAFNGGIAAPSANRFGRISPTTAQHVSAEFSAGIDMILDGGPTTVGIESTILDLSGKNPLVLRPGMISEEALSEVLGRPIVTLATRVSTTRAPGGLSSHYAPVTPVHVLSGKSFWSDVESAVIERKRIAVLAMTQKPSGLKDIPWQIASQDPEVYARELYAHLRDLDAMCCDIILVQAVPDGRDWHGIDDRLKRASVQGFNKKGVLNDR